MCQKPNLSSSFLGSKIDNFLHLKTEHTGHFLRSKRNIQNFAKQHTEALLCSVPNIPNI